MDYTVVFHLNLNHVPGVTLHSRDIIPSLKSKSVELLSRFYERATALNLEKALLEQLADLGLSLKAIRGITTDQASVMVLLGKLLTARADPAPFYHQLCLAHGLHHAVMDTLKLKKCEPDPGKPVQGEEVEVVLNLVDIPPEDDGECTFHSPNHRIQYRNQ